MQEFTTINIPSHLSSSVIERKAIDFIKTRISSSDIINHANDIRHLPYSVKVLIEISLNDFITKDSKVAYLTFLLQHYTNLLPQVDKGTLGDNNGSRTSNLDLIYNSKPLIEEIVFEILQQLALTGVSVDPNAFTAAEAADINSLLASILAELEILKGGNAVLSDQIEELQEDLTGIKQSLALGKKTTRQRITGIITTYVANKGADEVFDVIKPHLSQLMNGGLSSVTKFLELNQK